MKSINAAALTAAILVGIAAAAPADAHGGRGRVGVYIGGPVWGAWYPRPYYYPYGYYPYYPSYYPYYYPPFAYPYPSSPPAYIERDDVAPSPPRQPPPQQTQHWYYCPGAKAYYPYVRECPGGWQQVPAQPPS
jgi:hypothetical protein